MRDGCTGAFFVRKTHIEAKKIRKALVSMEKRASFRSNTSPVPVDISAMNWSLADMDAVLFAHS